MWTGVVIKKSKKTPVGISFSGKGVGSSPVTIAAVSGLTAKQTNLVPGLKVVSINGQSVEGMPSESVAKLIREAPAGPVTIEASGVLARARKANISDPLGLALRRVGRSIVITSVSESGLMASKGLKVGQKVMYINGNKCPRTTKDAVQLIQSSKKVCIVSIDVDISDETSDVSTDELSSYVSGSTKSITKLADWEADPDSDCDPTVDQVVEVVHSVEASKSTLKLVDWEADADTEDSKEVDPAVADDKNEESESTQKLVDSEVEVDDEANGIKEVDTVKDVPSAESITVEVSEIHFNPKSDEEKVEEQDDYAGNEEFNPGYADFQNEEANTAEVSERDIHFFTEEEAKVDDHRAPDSPVSVFREMKESAYELFPDEKVGCESPREEVDRWFELQPRMVGITLAAGVAAGVALTIVRRK